MQVANSWLWIIVARSGKSKQGGPSGEEVWSGGEVWPMCLEIAEAGGPEKSIRAPPGTRGLTTRASIQGGDAHDSIFRGGLS